MNQNFMRVTLSINFIEASWPLFCVWYWFDDSCHSNRLSIAIGRIFQFFLQRCAWAGTLQEWIYWIIIIGLRRRGQSEILSSSICVVFISGHDRIRNKFSNLKKMSLFSLLITLNQKHHIRMSWNRPFFPPFSHIG